MEEETPNSTDKYFVIFFYFLILYAFFKYSFHYFTLKGIPVLGPSIPFGNIKKALRPKKPRYQYFQELYSRIKIRGYKHGGIYLFFKPVYVPVDLDYVKTVLTKDFDYFSERGLEWKSRDFLNFHGQKWKELRVRLAPLFSSNNIKNFVVNVEKVSENLTEFLEHNRSVCIQDIAKNFTLDLMANLFFGVDLNSFLEENTPFEKHVKKIFKNSIYNSKLLILPIIFSKISSRISFDVFPKESLKYFEKTVREIIDFRDANQIKKNDVLQAMIDSDLKIEEIVSQCEMFTVFTNETISKVMTFAIFELSRNPQIQDKLKNEIEEVTRSHQEENLTYKALMEMTYLHQVIQETLRLYPIVPSILRKCTKDYIIPESKEVLDKGTGLLISILGIHRDPEIYENPNVFDPMRFSEENRSSRHPCAYIPYGEGPRICPAINFSTMILKVGLISALRNFRFTLNEKTKPLVLSKNSILMQPKNNLYINVEKL